MIDTEFSTLIKQQGLLTVALNEAEQQADRRLLAAGRGKTEYEQWRAWVLIMKAVSREINTTVEQLGLSPDDLGLRLYLADTQRTDTQFFPNAEAVVHAFYQDRLHAQDILMASAFDLARQAVKKMAAGGPRS